MPVVKSFRLELKGLLIIDPFSKSTEEQYTGKKVFKLEYTGMASLSGFNIAFQWVYSTALFFCFIVPYRFGID